MLDRSPDRRDATTSGGASDHEMFRGGWYDADACSFESIGREVRESPRASSPASAGPVPSPPEAR